MGSIIFDEEILDRLRQRHPRFHETAYLFVLSALHYVIEQLPDPRHISGRELAEGVRDLALERFGPMARTVLEHWGIRSTRDLGEIVFALVDCGVLIKQEDDSPEDFEGVFDFEDAFDRDYPWGADL
ncbi:MAG TPA: Minf_1886 family protein [Longimicrobiales bacterium]